MKVKVSVGTSTIAGYSVSIAAIVAAVLAFVNGDHSEQTLGVIVAGTLGIVSFIVTQIGRYAQAWSLIGEGHVVYQDDPLPDTPVVDAPEPGDLVSALPDLPVADVAGVPPDEGDHGETTAGIEGVAA